MPKVSQSGKKSPRRTKSIVLRGSEARTLETKLIRRTEVLQHVTTGILLTDANGVVTYFNPAFALICGESCRQIVDRNIEDLSRDRWEPEILEPLSNTIGTGESWHGYLSRKSQSGTRDWEMRISVLKKSNGAISGYIVSMRDVTDERKIENRLRQVQKMEALGDLARGIAHDLRNIFTPIIVNMELLLMESGKEPRERAYLEQVLRAARRGKDLVDQITMFARGGEGGRQIVSLGALIEDSLKILRPTLPSSIEIKTSLATREDEVCANPAQIHQVLMNLFINAVQAMKEGGGILTIILESADGPNGPESAAGPFLQLSVGDTGCGMSPEIMDRVFEPFFTIKDAGSGMGLAVVHGIVKNLGGVVTVDSEPGRGSVFRVFLPKAAPSDRTSDRTQRGKPRNQES